MEHVTLSAGVAHVPQGTSKEDAIRIADRLLYEAKDAGRNRVFATAVVGMRHTWPE
jgi:PleD family two-component response regulator